jgi:hypothetical protein
VARVNNRCYLPLFDCRYAKPVPFPPPAVRIFAPFQQIAYVTASLGAIRGSFIARGAASPHGIHRDYEFSLPQYRKIGTVRREYDLPTFLCVLKMLHYS